MKLKLTVLAAALSFSTTAFAGETQQTFDAADMQQLFGQKSESTQLVTLSQQEMKGTEGAALPKQPNPFDPPSLLRPPSPAITPGMPDFSPAWATPGMPDFSPAWTKTPTTPKVPTAQKAPTAPPQPVQKAPVAVLGSGLGYVAPAGTPAVLGSGLGYAAPGTAVLR